MLGVGDLVADDRGDAALGQLQQRVLEHHLPRRAEAGDERVDPRRAHRGLADQQLGLGQRGARDDRFDGGPHCRVVQRLRVVEQGR